MLNLSAITGRYISNAAAGQHPRISACESQTPNKSPTATHHCATTGRYVPARATQRCSGAVTLSEN